MPGAAVDAAIDDVSVALAPVDSAAAEALLVALLSVLLALEDADVDVVPVDRVDVDEDEDEDEDDDVSPVALEAKPSK